MLWDPNKDKPVEVKLDAVSLHLLRAVDYIQRYGWCQHSLKTSYGAVCMVGSLLETGGIISTFKALKRTDVGIIDAPRWNDRLSQCNGKTIVQNMLKSAAYKGEGK